MNGTREKALARLSDKDLVERLRRLRTKERQTTIEILHHLNELERRMLHLSMGHRSLFEYCTHRLHYSESAASRRIRTARCLRAFPEIVGMLAAGQAGLSTVSLIAGILTPGNKDEILAKITGKSHREVEAIVAAYRPRQAIREQIKPVAIKPRATEETPVFLTLPTTTGAGGNSVNTSSQRPVDNTQKQPPIEERFKIVFGASSGFRKKIKQVEMLLSTKNPRGVSLEQVFETLVDFYLDRTDPKSKSNKKKVRRASKEAKPNGQISAAARREVRARDQDRCTFVGDDGKRCGSSWNLHVDHVWPRGKGGNNEVDNLRLLCAAHNRFEAERAYGKSFMLRFAQKRE